MALSIYIASGLVIVLLISVFLVRHMSQNKSKAEAKKKRKELHSEIAKTVDRIDTHKKKLSKLESLLPKHVKDPDLEAKIIDEASLIDHDHVVSKLNKLRKDVEFKRRKYNISIIREYLVEVERINALLDKSFEIMDNWFLYKLH
jgi:hypothetical protein